MTQKEDIETINHRIPALSLDELRTWDAVKLNDVATSIRKLTNRETIDDAYANAQKKREAK